MRILKYLVIVLVVAVLALVGFVYLMPEQAAILAFDLQRSQAGLERKQIDLPDGQRYVYLEGGKGEPLMLLHGFGGNKDHFTTVSANLTPHYYVISPDHAGNGESSRPKDGDYSPTAQAKRLHALAQKLGLKRMHLGGSSMGGQIALTYAALYPEEVKSLWLLAPAGIWSAPESEVGRAMRENGVSFGIDKTEADFFRDFDYALYKPPFYPRPILRVMARERIRNADVDARTFEQIMADSIEKRITGLGIPALIVWGDKDRIIHPDTAGVLHKLLPKSQVIRMHDVGHLSMMEQPEQTAKDYLKFRAGL